VENDGLRLVVVNDEDQYSTWPADKPLPPGWAAVGDPQSENDCLQDIERLWVDMRPRGLRERANGA
jgi:MbtH protein